MTRTTAMVYSMVIILSCLASCRIPRRHSNNDAPAVSGRRVVSLLLWVALLAFADLVADEATDRCTANRSDRAAARKDCTTNGADSSADRSTFVSRRHRLTTT